MSTTHRIKCNQCGGEFQPRNWMRHRKACNRRMREAGAKPFKRSQTVQHGGREWVVTGSDSELGIVYLRRFVWDRAAGTTRRLTAQATTATLRRQNPPPRPGASA